MKSSHHTATMREQTKELEGLRDMRCPTCRRLLAKERLETGAVEIKCPKCKIKVLIRR